MGENRYKVGTVDDFKSDSQRIITEVDGLEIGVFKVDGEYHALLNFCVHQGAPLCEGKLRGRTIPGDDGWEWKFDAEEKYLTCPWHAWKFDVTNGNSIDSSKHSIPTFDVTIEGEDVYITR